MFREENFSILIERLGMLAELSAPFIAALRACVVEKTFTRNQFVLGAGHRQVYLWFIIEGFAREVSQTESFPFTLSSWFWVPGDLVIQGSFYINEQSLVDIEIYRGSVVLEISDQDLSRLEESFPQVNIIVEQFRHQDYQKRKRYAADLVMLKRLDHIELLFNEHKMLFNTALHRDLASFFGVKSHNLTRYLKNLH
ncbi:Crp/Fnr family transcriptional regulator [Pedobacter jeongneungensis]|uniref:Crp/Fnr family transcriptional regulator n=1 Tax=Pedobacter jeongneungensis TaxID=947309 RepID=UPI000469A329|nr:Crp/Fnr family transcriptional regulator [Pedobacter jeongneungensis]